MANEDVGSYPMHLGVICLHQGAGSGGPRAPPLRTQPGHSLPPTNRRNLAQKTEPQFTQLLAGEGQDEAQLHPPTPRPAFIEYLLWSPCPGRVFPSLPCVYPS